MSRNVPVIRPPAAGSIPPPSITSVGVDVVQVISDDKHYRPFMCSVCVKVVALDAVVSNGCSHPICKTCLQDHVVLRRSEGPNIPCPQCSKPLQVNMEEGSSPTDNDVSEHVMQMGKHVFLGVRPLIDAQPLAYQCLENIQVACMGSNSKRCHWSGNYSDFPQHAQTCKARMEQGPPIADQANPRTPATTSAKVRRKPIHRTTSLPDLSNTLRPPMRRNSPLPVETLISPHQLSTTDESSVTGMSSSLESPLGVQKRRVDRNSELSATIHNDDRNDHLRHKNHPKENFRKSMSLRDFSRMSSSDENGELPNEGWPASPQHPMRWEATGSFETTQMQQQGDTPPSLVQRTKSEVLKERERLKMEQKNQLAGDEVNGQPRRNTSKPVPEDKRLRKATPALLKEKGHDSLSSGGDGSSAVGGPEWNTSINSLTGWGGVGSTRDVVAMEPVVETDSQSRQSESTNSTDRERIVELMARAEKLKKQANAKFNKGDFNSARMLYTQGIQIMSILPHIGPTEGEMLSNMHSNRAVTYFREKNFSACISDCDVALRYDPYYEKSWIRKWRALMALGKVQVAVECLESGANSLPESSKIQKELQKAQGEMDLVSRAKELLAKRDYRSVQDLLKGQTSNKSSSSSGSADNIALLFLAARADAYMGCMEDSMDKVNRALRYNPTIADGLAVRGCILYLAGETEKGLHLLQDAYGRDKENKPIKLELQQCHRTHQALSKGRSCVKRGRYLEAVEHFTAAMKEKTLVPEKTHLYAMVRCERAEAWMLSQKYHQALKDCEDVISAQPENSTAWTVRAEILIALDKAQEAQEELMHIRKTWGSDDPIIEEGYRRVDFEMRVLKAEEELDAFVLTLEQGLGTPQPSPASKSDRRYSDESRLSQSSSKKSKAVRRNSISGNGGRRPSKEGTEYRRQSSSRGLSAGPEYKRQSSNRRLSGDKKVEYRRSGSSRRLNAESDKAARSDRKSADGRRATSEVRRTQGRRSASGDRAGEDTKDSTSGSNGLPQESPRVSSSSRQSSSRNLVSPRRQVKKSRSSRKLDTDGASRRRLGKSQSSRGLNDEKT